MPNNKSSLRVTELDFDTIKNNLKNYLSSQDVFSDYDFEGSALNLLLDILAYNTHYNAFYANMNANESFIDTAVVRNAVVSLAKALGYTPRSTRSATATVDVSGLDSAVTTLVKTTTFTGTKDGVTYSFVPKVDYAVTANSVDSVILKEGKWVNTTFIYDSQNSNQRFVVPNETIDTSTLIVTVQDNVSSSTRVTYTLADDINVLTSDDEVYFLQEVESGKYEIYFGDGVLGKQLTDGNVIKLQYIVCNGSDANKISTFTGPSGSTVTTLTAAGGGDEAEDIESIKRTAPKNYQAQGRAVTARDYETVITNNFGNVSSVNIYGGDEISPPEYGKVFISLNPKENYVISQTEKQEILDTVLNSRNVVTVIPEFIDPEFIFLRITSAVRFDKNKTTQSATALANSVKTSILAFASSNLNKFNQEFRYSGLVKKIDNTSTAITGNLTDVLMEKSFNTTPGVVNSYSVNFNNPIFNPHVGHVGSLSSEPFKYEDTNGAIISVYVDDDGDEESIVGNKIGNVRIYKIVNGERKYINRQAGSVEYETGKVTLNIKVPSQTTSITLLAKPEKYDIVPKANTIINIVASGITVNVTAEGEKSNGVPIHAGSASSTNSGSTLRGSGK